MNKTKHKPIESLNLLFASALSSESKYHTVTAYLQQKFSAQNLTLLVETKVFIFHLFMHIMANTCIATDLVANDGCTS